MELLQIIIILIAVNIGTIIGVMYAAHSGSIQFYNEARNLKKSKRKDEILKYTRQNGSIRNKDIEELLDVSPKTATNYLQELKAEGKLTQHGKRGRSVHYTIA